MSLYIDSGDHARSAVGNWPQSVTSFNYMYFPIQGGRLVEYCL